MGQSHSYRPVVGLVLALQQRSILPALTQEVWQSIRVQRPNVGLSGKTLAGTTTEGLEKGVTGEEGYPDELIHAYACCHVSR